MFTNRGMLFLMHFSANLWFSVCQSCAQMHLHLQMQVQMRHLHLHLHLIPLWWLHLHSHLHLIHPHLHLRLHLIQMHLIESNAKQMPCILFNCCAFALAFDSSFAFKCASPHLSTSLVCTLYLLILITLIVNSSARLVVIYIPVAGKQPEKSWVLCAPRA